MTRGLFNKREPAFVWNALKGTWQPATMLNIPQPTKRPRTHTVDIQRKIYQKTRGHLRPRSQSEINPTSPPAGAVASVHNPKDGHIANDGATRLPPLAEGSHTKHLDSHLLQNYLVVRSELILNQQVFLRLAKGPSTNQGCQDRACHPGSSQVRKLNRDKHKLAN